MFGTRITFSDDCLADTTERTFPVSRHRSARLHKKLVKKFGGEFRKEPAIFQTPSGIVAHTSFRAEIEIRFCSTEPTRIPGVGLWER